MAYVTDPAQNKQGFRALDADLPFLASEVAIDIDNILKGKAKEQSAMRLLAEKLSGAIETDTQGTPLRSRMDMATLGVMGEAFSESFNMQSKQNINDLLAKAGQIIKILMDNNPGTNPSELKKAHSFCIALSRASAAYSESIRDLRTAHPNRG